MIVRNTIAKEYKATKIGKSWFRKQQQLFSKLYM